MLLNNTPADYIAVSKSLQGWGLVFRCLLDWNHEFQFYRICCTLFFLCFWCINNILNGTVWINNRKSCYWHVNKTSSEINFLQACNYIQWPPDGASKPERLEALCLLCAAARAPTPAGGCVNRTSRAVCSTAGWRHTADAPSFQQRLCPPSLTFFRRRRQTESRCGADGEGRLPARLRFTGAHRMEQARQQSRLSGNYCVLFTWMKQTLWSMFISHLVSLVMRSIWSVDHGWRVFILSVMRIFIHPSVGCYY